LWASQNTVTHILTQASLLFHVSEILKCMDDMIKGDIKLEFFAI